MTIPHLFCPRLTTGVVILEDAESWHALRSLRLRPGSEVFLFDGQGRFAYGTIQADSERQGAKKNVRIRSNRSPRGLVRVEQVKQAAAPVHTLTLLVAACKGPSLAWMIEKLTELGTTRIVLTNFERSVVQVHAGHLEKLRRVAIEAAKQSQRLWLPEVTASVSLADALASRTHGPLLVADPGAEVPYWIQWWQTKQPPCPDLTVVVGPEGGLTTSELRALRDAGAESVRLAETVLRVETAAMSVAANWAASTTGDQTATAATHSLTSAEKRRA